MVRWKLVLLTLTAALAVDAITITIRENNDHNYHQPNHHHHNNYHSGENHRYHSRMEASQDPRQRYQNDERRPHYGDNSRENYDGHHHYQEHPKQQKVAQARSGLFHSVYGPPYSYGPGYKVVLLGKLGKLGLIAGLGKLGALGAMTHLLKLGALGGLIGLGKLGTLGALLGFGKVGLLGTLGAAHVAKNLLHKGHVHVVINKRNDDPELLHYVDNLPNAPHGQGFVPHNSEYVPIGGYAHPPSARNLSPETTHYPHRRQGFYPLEDRHTRGLRTEERRERFP